MQFLDRFGKSDSRIRTVGAGFGYFAAIANIAAFAWYFWDVKAGMVTTNPVTWWMWVGETLIGLLLYADQTRDLPKWITEFTAMIGVVLMSAYLLWEVLAGNASMTLETVQPIDLLSTVAALGALGYWLRTRKTSGAKKALWVFQFALIAAAFPLIRAAYADPSAEPLGPWALWTAAFVLQVICVRCRWDGDIESLLNPFNYAITHGLVALIVWQGAAS